MNGSPHDPFARECVVILIDPIPAAQLHGGQCPACREMSALIDLDPDFGSADDGRPALPGEQPGGETRKPLVRARYPLTPGQANVSLEDDDGSPALPGERADEEGE